MFAKYLLIDDQDCLDWQSPETSILDPTWDKIELAINSMDGDRRSMVTIGPIDREECFMIIGGGNKGAYICNVSDSKGQEFAVIDPKQVSDQTAEILVGQPLYRSIKECIGLQSALVAARKYAETGELDTALSWKRV